MTVPAREDVLAARRMYEEGRRPAEILRHFAVSRPELSIVHLMALLSDAFGLPHEAVQCLGGWWHDGSGELSDERINALISGAITAASTGKQAP